MLALYSRPSGVRTPRPTDFGFDKAMLDSRHGLGNIFVETDRKADQTFMQACFLALFVAADLKVV